MINAHFADTIYYKPDQMAARTKCQPFGITVCNLLIAHSWIYPKILLTVLRLVDHNKKGTNKNNRVKGPLWEQRNVFGTRLYDMPSIGCIVGLTCSGRFILGIVLVLLDVFIVS